MAQALQRNCLDRGLSRIRGLRGLPTTPLPPLCPRCLLHSPPLSALPNICPSVVAFRLVSCLFGRARGHRPYVFIFSSFSRVKQSLVKNGVIVSFFSSPFLFINFFKVAFMAEYDTISKHLIQTYPDDFIRFTLGRADIEVLEVLETEQPTVEAGAPIA